MNLIYRIHSYGSLASYSCDITKYERNCFVYKQVNNQDLIKTTLCMLQPFSQKLDLQDDRCSSLLMELITLMISPASNNNLAIILDYSIEIKNSDESHPPFNKISFNLGWVYTGDFTVWLRYKLLLNQSMKVYKAINHKNLDKNASNCDMWESLIDI